MSLATLQKLAVNFLKGQLGNSVKQVEPFAGQLVPGEVKTNLVFPPAVLVYVSGGDIQRFNGGALGISTLNTAYCLTRFNDKATKASQDAMTLAESVAELIEGEEFGLGPRGNAATIKAVGNGHQLGLAAQGFSLWLVNWEQTIIFGQKSWLQFEERDGIDPIPLEIWAGDEPVMEDDGA